MSGVSFTPFGKLQRLYDSRHGVVITEKVDGTNAGIHIRNGIVAGVQSRKRLITPEDDNYGFAAWVTDNEAMIVELLGDGLHFGEWMGRGIQRGYGLNDNRFLLFNTPRWRNTLPDPRLPQLGVVPLLYWGDVEENGLDCAVAYARSTLELEGSQVNPGYVNFEGVVVFFPDSGASFKHVINAPSSKKKTRG